MVSTTLPSTWMMFPVSDGSERHAVKLVTCPSANDAQAATTPMAPKRGPMAALRRWADRAGVRPVRYPPERFAVSRLASLPGPQTDGSVEALPPRDSASGRERRSWG